MAEFSPWTMALRLGLSFLAGAMIGFERSSRHKVAGLRTHILICVGSTLLMLLSIWMPSAYPGGGDPSRIAAQVVSGMGFLGAGAILRLGNNIRGLTTAASLWLVSALGLALGAGFYWAALTAFVLSIFTLIVLERVELRFFPKERNKLLELGFRGEADTRKVMEILKDFGIRVQSIDLDQTLEKDGPMTLRLLVGFPVDTDLQRLARVLRKDLDVKHIEVKEKY